MPVKVNISTFGDINRLAIGDVIVYGGKQNTYYNFSRLTRKTACTILWICYLIKYLMVPNTVVN